jgi:hypothetical protein
LYAKIQGIKGFGRYSSQNWLNQHREICWC